MFEINWKSFQSSVSSSLKCGQSLDIICTKTSSSSSLSSDWTKHYHCMLITIVASWGQWKNTYQAYFHFVPMNYSEMVGSFHNTEKLGMLDEGWKSCHHAPKSVSRYVEFFPHWWKCHYVINPANFTIQDFEKKNQFEIES